MNKKFLYRIYCGIFIGACLVPAVGMAFVKSDGTKEKRDLAAFPSVTTEDGKLNFGFFDQFGDWFSDHYAFRSDLVSADGRLTSSLLGTSPNSDVIVGSDGWLYYGDTADDYLNINTLSDREISNICHNLRMMRDGCEAAGARFLFFSAPNKNSVYPEHMPFNYVPADAENNLARITAELSGEDFFLDMKSALLGAEASIPLYHKTDTHWNNMGAYVGHTAVMSALGKVSCPVGSQWTTAKDRLGDLAAMIYPAEKAKDTQVYSDYEFRYNYLGRFRGLDDVTINTVCEGQDGELLMFRDSYGEAILPYMAECFGSAEFSRVVPYRLNNIQGRTVVLELVERNLGNLQKYAPVMAAPETDISALDTVNVSGADIRSETVGQFIHLYGTVPEEYLSGDSHRIFVTAGDDSFEAFNCFEDKLLCREGEHAGNGFSLYLPENTNIENLMILVK